MKTNTETKIIVLGGLGEVGKNMYCLMHEDEIIIIENFLIFILITRFYITIEKKNNK